MCLSLKQCDFADHFPGGDKLFAFRNLPPEINIKLLLFRRSPAAQARNDMLFIARHNHRLCSAFEIIP